ncbi:MAG: penicillin-binding protein 2 [Lentisphaeria bacterium]|nr:penicillin-binding protein 2 [Lentisphaeria bacterium]
MNLSLENLTSLRVRIGILLAIAFILFSIIAIRLWEMQVMRGAKYREKAQSQSVRTIRVPAVRGRILARDGTPLAVNRVTYEVLLHPAELRARSIRDTVDNILAAGEEAARRLGRENPLTREKVLRHLNYYPGIPLELFRELTQKEGSGLGEMLPQIRGLEIAPSPVREYPFGPLAAHLLGYAGRTDPDDADDRKRYSYYISSLTGKSGLEKAMDQDLCGSPGRKLVIVNSVGFVHEYLEAGSAVARNGLDLELTLDLKAQQTAEQLLGERCGAIVLLNAENGEILAMASSPRYDLNLFTGRIPAKEYRILATDERYPFMHRAAQGSYMPGSIIKPLTAIAALHAGVRPEETFNCEGQVPFGYTQIRCMNHAVHGEIDLYDAIKKSCNCYFVTVGLRAGIDLLSRVFASAGIGSPTGFELPERRGFLPVNSPAWRPQETAYVAFGQGKVELTPLQAAVYAAALANGGTRWRPHLIRRVLDTSGNGPPVSVRDTVPEIRGHLDATDEMLSIIKDAMHRVVWEPGGSGSRARTDKIELSGKTGTADVVAHGEKYKNTWFIGFGRDPVKGTLYAISILIERGESGGRTAAEAAGEFFNRWL